MTYTYAWAKNNKDRRHVRDAAPICFHVKQPKGFSKELWLYIDDNDPDGKIRIFETRTIYVRVVEKKSKKTQDTNTNNHAAGDGEETVKIVPKQITEHEVFNPACGYYVGNVYIRRIERCGDSNDDNHYFKVYYTEITYDDEEM